MGGCLRYAPDTGRSPPGGHMAIVIREVSSITVTPQKEFFQYNSRVLTVNGLFAECHTTIEMSPVCPRWKRLGTRPRCPCRPPLRGPHRMLPFRYDVPAKVSPPMKRSYPLTALVSLLLPFLAFSHAQTSERVVDLTASDGTKLKATHFGATKPGPGVLLLHQCNRRLTGGLFLLTPRAQWKTRTSWRAKLHKPMRPKPVPISDHMAKRFGSGIMLIPTALEADAVIRKIPRGQVCYAG